VENFLQSQEFNRFKLEELFQSKGNTKCKEKKGDIIPKKEEHGKQRERKQIKRGFAEAKISRYDSRYEWYWKRSAKYLASGHGRNDKVYQVDSQSCQQKSPWGYKALPIFIVLFSS